MKDKPKEKTLLLALEFCGKVKTFFENMTITETFTNKDAFDLYTQAKTLSLEISSVVSIDDMTQEK